MDFFEGIIQFLQNPESFPEIVGSIILQISLGGILGLIGFAFIQKKKQSEFGWFSFLWSVMLFGPAELIKKIYEVFFIVFFGIVSVLNLPQKQQRTVGRRKKKSRFRDYSEKSLGWEKCAVLRLETTRPELTRQKPTKIRERAEGGMAWLSFLGASTLLGLGVLHFVTTRLL